MADNSIFRQLGVDGALQTFLDSRLDKFNQAWYKNYFSFSAPQLSLSYTAVLGESVITTAASVVSRDAETPLRARQAIAKLSGEIPAIKVMRKLNESHVRDYMALQELSNISDKAKADQVWKLIWDDSKYVADSVDKRIDVMCAQALSTGKINIDSDTNPDGIVLPAIDLLHPDENKTNASVDWATSSTSKPIEDISAVVDKAAGTGLMFEKIIMDAKAYALFAKSAQVKDSVSAFFGITKSASSSATAPITLDRINEYMMASRLPVIEVVNIKVAIEKNGVSSVMNPWEEANVAFVPAGNLGEIKNAVAVEETRPVEKVVYAKKENTLISKWSNNEPFGEWTKAELNAFPALTAINQIHLLSTNAGFTL